MTSPNLFEFATSELSQDAVLCWLASWAKPELSNQDSDLPALGRAFLQALFAKARRPLPEPITSISVCTQHKHIDVLVIVNDTYAVCIEDKVGTTEHTNQLLRYVKLLREERFADENIIRIYVQTYEQGDYDGVGNDGYNILNREHLLGILRPYVGVTTPNAIVQDFYCHLQRIDREVNAYTALPLGGWPLLAWTGFFAALQKQLGYGKWEYVPNQSGGFLGYWWSERSEDDVKPYLQLERSDLCFKITVDNMADRSHQRDAWSRRVLQAARSFEPGVVRPKKLGSGRHMTVARLADYRVPSANGTLDLTATIARLHAAEAVLDRAMARGNG